MNRKQAETKLKKLTILLFVRDNIAKIVPTLKYSVSEEQAQKEIAAFLNELPFKIGPEEWKYLFSLSLRDVAKFAYSQDMMLEIQKCQEILKENTKKEAKNKTMSLF